MLGPFKVVGPFVKMTKGADDKLIRRIVWRAILFSCASLLVAALLGETIVEKYGIPLPVIALTGGIILFLVALQGILQQFKMQPHQEDNAILSLDMAINPLAFPTLVTPYGIAAVIVFMALSQGVEDRLIIAGMLIGIMSMNLVMMLFVKKILYFKGAFLLILGAVLGIVQAALGLQIINNALRQVLSMGS